MGASYAVVLNSEIINSNKEAEHEYTRVPL